MTASPFKSQIRGFTLLELSLSLLVIALLGSGLLTSLANQRNLADQQTALRQLEEMRESLIGFALTNGRLPCPAKATLDSSEALAGREDCTLQHGVFPWSSLGLPETDPWGHRFTYYASERFTGALPNGSLAAFTLDTLGNANIYDSNGKSLASELPAVLLSHGPSATGAYTPQGRQIGGSSGDEYENADADLSFISHTPTPVFDDLVVWIIPSILKSRMVSAGKLP